MSILEGIISYCNLEDKQMINAYGDFYYNMNRLPVIPGTTWNYMYTESETGYDVVSLFGTKTEESVENAKKILDDLGIPYVITEN